MDSLFDDDDEQEEEEEGNAWLAWLAEEEGEWDLVARNRNKIQSTVFPAKQNKKVLKVGPKHDIEEQNMLFFPAKKKVLKVGIEPTTLAVWKPRSNH